MIEDHGPHIIMDKLMNYHSIDLQWGNHDIIWMGAACGHPACILNVLRICARYDNLDILEDGYGINVRTITEFAKNTYINDECLRFMPHVQEDDKSGFTRETLSKTQKAAAIIQFKLEGQLIKKHPEYKMYNRLLLDKMNLKNGEIKINNKDYKILDTNFPTIDLNDPYKLTKEEQEVVDKLVKTFQNSEKLQKHIKFLYNKGSLYRIYNGNLLIHACVPVDEKKNLVEVDFGGVKLKGKKYLDKVDKLVRQAYFSQDGSLEKENAMDFMWYLWCGKDSPLFGKDAMKTFERYFVEDESTWKETKNAFYLFTHDEEMCRMILKEFNINEETGHIICGHVPIKSKVGESPIKANGKLLMIDGGLSKAYQKTTGIAGYTLIYNSYGLILTAHQKFCSTYDAIKNELDIYSTKQIIEKVERKYISDTDRGKELLEQIKDLDELLNAYRTGEIKQGKR